jgi:hypothetical protein
MERVMLWIGAICVVLALGAVGAFGGCCVGALVAMSAGSGSSGSGSASTAVWIVCSVVGLILGLGGGGYIAGKWILRAGR